MADNKKRFKPLPFMEQESPYKYKQHKPHRLIGYGAGSTMKIRYQPGLYESTKRRWKLK